MKEDRRDVWDRRGEWRELGSPMLGDVVGPPLVLEGDMNYSGRSLVMEQLDVMFPLHTSGTEMRLGLQEPSPREDNLMEWDRKTRRRSPYLIEMSALLRRMNWGYDTGLNRQMEFVILLHHCHHLDDPRLGSQGSRG
jgi:hypothetical protein